MMNDAIIIEGKLVGPTVCIIGGVHGNELAGIMAIDAVKDSMKIERGKVILIYGNPRAIELGVRKTEQNLNRMFRDDCTEVEKLSYEYKRAVEIRAWLDQADLCLDLHASYSSETVPFAFTEENGMGMVGKFPVKYVCSNIDAFEKGGTDGYMNGRGKIGICVECGYLGDREALGVALRCIEVVLEEMGMVERRVAREERSSVEYLKVTDLYVSQTDHFRLVQQWADFAKIPAGVVIGYDDSSAVKYQKEFFILFARDLNEKGGEAFLVLKKHR